MLRFTCYYTVIKASTYFYYVHYWMDYIPGRVKKLGTRYKSPQGYKQDCILAGLTWLNWFNGVCFLWNCHIWTSFEIGFVFSQASGSICQTKPEPIKGPIEFPAHLWMSVVFLIKPQEKQDEDTCALLRGRRLHIHYGWKTQPGPESLD